MRYNHLEMLPEKAFSPVGKRMTLEGGGVGKVLSTGASLAAGQSPLGAFGSALGGEILNGAMHGGGGGGGRGGPYAPGQPGSSNPYGMGNMYQNQQFQGFGPGNNNSGFGMGYQGGMPTNQGAFSQYYNMPGMSRETAAQEAAEQAARAKLPPPGAPAPALNPQAGMNPKGGAVTSANVRPMYNPAGDRGMVAPGGIMGLGLNPYVNELHQVASATQATPQTSMSGKGGSTSGGSKA